MSIGNKNHYLKISKNIINNLQPFVSPRKDIISLRTCGNHGRRFKVFPGNGLSGVKWNRALQRGKSKLFAGYWISGANWCALKIFAIGATLKLEILICLRAREKVFWQWPVAQRGERERARASRRFLKQGRTVSEAVFDSLSLFHIWGAALNHARAIEKKAPASHF